MSQYRIGLATNEVIAILDTDPRLMVAIESADSASRVAVPAPGDKLELLDGLARWAAAAATRERVRRHGTVRA
jgi:hypothetical protein